MAYKHIPQLAVGAKVSKYTPASMVAAWPSSHRLAAQTSCERHFVGLSPCLRAIAKRRSIESAIKRQSKHSRLQRPEPNIAAHKKSDIMSIKELLKQSQQFSPIAKIQYDSDDGFAAAMTRWSHAVHPKIAASVAVGTVEDVQTAVSPNGRWSQPMTASVSTMAFY